MPIDAMVIIATAISLVIFLRDCSFCWEGGADCDRFEDAREP